jgi:tetratricopeptide (TPR) repeat protein
MQPRDTLAAGFKAVANKGAAPWDVWALQQITVQRENSDQGPPGSLLLAIRAARRALHDDPDDALAHLRLGRAYHFLQQHTMERGLNDEFPLLEQLRKVQTIVALKRAVRLRPDLLAAHDLLVDIFLEARGYDLALPHIQQRTRLNQEAGPLPNESAEEFAARIERLITVEAQLGKQVRDMLNLADTQTFELGAYGKARYAESNGLPGYALEQLLRSTYEEFGREGAILELYLLLHDGRTEHFRSIIKPDQEPVLTPFNYHWMQTLLAAADGNYDQAGEHLQQIAESGPAAPRSLAQGRASFAALAALDGLQILGGSSNNPLQLLWPTRISNRFVAPGPGSITPETRRAADLHCLHGMLELEAGRIDAARRAFLKALDLWNSAEGSPRLARHYLRLTARE